MAFSTSDILTPQPTRADFAQAFGNNQRLIRFFEQLTSDVRQTLPDAIVSITDISSAPFLLQAASSLAPNGYVLVVGNGLVETTTTGPNQLSIALDVPISIAHGGTGATTAAVARTNLGAAASGANSDITSLSGLTTPLSIPQGGTGANTAAGARAGLGAAARGANSDITSITGLTTPLALTEGGTGATAAAAALANIGGAPLQNPVFGGSITLNTGAAQAALYLDANAGQYRLTYAQTGNVPRWAWGVTNGAETGANVGSDWFLSSYSDAGAFLGTPIYVARATSAITFGGPLLSPNMTGVPTVPTAAPGTNTTQSASTAFVQAAVAGGTAGVASFNGRTGVVVPTTGDYTAAQVTGAAASGANSNITSLTGLTTALSIPQGGTGATTAAAACTNLGAAASGANNNITSLTGLTTPLSVAQGGTGTATATGSGSLVLSVAPTLSSPIVGTQVPHTSTTVAASTQFVINEFTAPVAIGSVTAAPSVRSALFSSATATNAAVASGVATTVYAFPNTVPQVWQVFANIGTTGAAANYTAFATVCTDGASARIVANNGTNMTLTLSGLNLQATQTSGVAQTLNTVLTRIG